MNWFGWAAAKVAFCETNAELPLPSFLQINFPSRGKAPEVARKFGISALELRL
jgi:hypothetical protein